MKTESVIRIVPHEEIYTEAALEVIIELYPKVAERLFKSRTPAVVQTPVAVGETLPWQPTSKTHK
jgi:hypothetical protein